MVGKLWPRVGGIWYPYPGTPQNSFLEFKKISEKLELDGEGIILLDLGGPRVHKSTGTGFHAWHDAYNNSIQKFKRLWRAYIYNIHTSHTRAYWRTHPRGHHRQNRTLKIISIKSTMFGSAVVLKG